MIEAGPALVRAYRYLRGGPGASLVLPALPGGDPLTCRAMLAGVRLNGHEYRQGSTCAYVPRVNRRNVAEGSSTSHDDHIALINAFTS